MSSKKFFLIMLGVVALLMAGFGFGALRANKMLKQESSNLVDLKLQDIVLKKQQTDLFQAKKDIAEYSELEEITKSIVPQDKDQASTIAEIATLAQQAGISLGSIEFPKSELGQIAAKGKSSDTKNKTQIRDNAKTQLTELEDLKGVYIMDINISNHSGAPVLYEQIIRYLELLESNRRTAQVTNISIRPDSEAPNRFHFSVTLNTYVRPE